MVATRTCSTAVWTVLRLWLRGLVKGGSIVTVLVREGKERDETVVPFARREKGLVLIL